MSVNIVKAGKCDEDGKLIMRWRNDPVSRRNFLNSEIKTWAVFRHEYYNEYFKNIPLFAVINGTKFAFISFCLYADPGVWNIGINMAPEYRGRKLSAPVIKAAMQYIEKTHTFINCVVAEIKAFNIPSIKSFTRCGFDLVRTLQLPPDTALQIYEHNIHK